MYNIMTIYVLTLDWDKHIKTFEKSWNPSNTMNISKKLFASKRWGCRSVLVVFVFFFAALAIQSRGQIYTITSQNSSLQINLAGGLSNWTIDSVNQLNLQWFYYSVGAGPVYSIDSVAPWSVPTISHGSSPTLSETYANSIIGVTTRYTLQGQPAGSGQATLGTAITLNNTSAASQVYHFYQYSDFDLGGVSGNQNVQFNINGAASAYQVIQNGLGGVTLTGNVTALSGGVAIAPEEQAAIYNGSMFGLGNGNAAPTLNNTLTAGSGNVVYAYEWNVTLAAAGNLGSSLTISEAQAVVPEPSPVALISSGVLLIGLLCWHRWRQVQLPNLALISQCGKTRHNSSKPFTN
jgi:hypothetical protein